jgi:microcin C transport system substrate-binding protein
LIPLLCCLFLIPPARGEDVVTHSHALTVLGTPALPPDFQAFRYVNPNAPKGGEVHVATVGTFDNFNPFILRGTADAHGVTAWAAGGSSIGHLWESLLVGSADEAASGYGHLAESIDMPASKMWVAFTIRPDAKFSDGHPVTAEDVAWTFRTLMEKGRPPFRVQFADVKDVVVEGPRRVRFNFNTDQNRDLPLLVGGLTVLPKHFFEGRDFASPLTDPPVGSGPYKIAAFELGRSITYERDPNWWAKDLPTARGTNNFDRVRIDFYRDSTVAMEAFKAGRVDVRAENISKNWAVAYDFPAVQSGLVQKKAFANQLPTGIQGYALNTRRPVFADRRVRQAIALAFDFEWTNKNLFYGAYVRTTSYFSNTPLASEGLPSPEEQALLKPFAATLPPEVFSQPYALPVTDGSGNNRDALKQAFDLLKDAGWTVKDRKLVDAKGQPMSFTFLVDDPSYERVTLPYVQNLKKLGMDVQVRTVDPAQYQHSVDDYDFDVIMMTYPGSELPGNETRDEWSCAAAKEKGSANYPGICDPAVDALIEKLIAATDRPTLTTIGRALDRVLLWNWYLVPNWHIKSTRLAWWDRFGMPDKPIREGVNFDTWWIDPAKAAHIEESRH